MKNRNQKGIKGGAPAPPFFSIRGIGFFGVFLFAWGLLVGMGSKPPQIGGPAPSFEAETLEGKKVSLEDYRGKVVLLTFWATWCEPCKKEMPEIQAAYEKHKEEGLAVLAVNFGEKQGPARAFFQKTALTFPSLLDRRADIAERFGVISLPVTFFIDRDGIIRERISGGILTADGIGRSFQTLQKSGSKSG